LSFQSALLREKAENRQANGDADESDEDDEIEEDFRFITPIDTVDPYTSFKQALTSCVVLPFLSSHN
jgi:importin-7